MCFDPDAEPEDDQEEVFEYPEEEEPYEEEYAIPDHECESCETCGDCHYCRPL